MLDRFQDISRDNARDVMSKYGTICLSGGEPLIPDNIGIVNELAYRAKYMHKKVYIYTNLSHLPNIELLKIVDGWSVGFHPSQTGVSDFMIRVYRMVAFGARNIRVLVEDDKVDMLDELIGVVHIKTWERDKCDKTELEDWYKITS